MKALSVLLISALLSLFYPPVSGQNILLFNPSASLNAVGSTGTALPSEDPFSFTWNPAQLGYTSQRNNLNYIFYPSRQTSLQTYFRNYEIKGSAFNLGYNFKDLTGLPLSFGFGYSNFEIDYGPYASFRPGYGTSSFPRDYYNAYSIGIGVDYFVQLSAGFSIKDMTSILYFVGEDSEIKVNRTVNDLGLLLNVPVLKLIDENLSFEVDEGVPVKPTFNFSLGYSKSNIGDSIYFIDVNQADPLPRVDRIGYGISTGISYTSDDISINVFNFSFTAEAEDLLYTQSLYSHWKYQSTLSDLRFWKNVVLLEGDDNIVSRAGLKIDFAETVSLLSGHFQGRGYSPQRKTNGIELRAKGLFKLYALWAKDPITDFLRDYIDIRYYNTNYFADSNLETKMTGLVFYVHNLNNLF